MGEIIKDTFMSVKNRPLDYRVWKPDGEPVGIVQLIHGMAEHIDRYEETALDLNKSGYIVAGHTQLGHGSSAAVLGYFADENGWSALEDDVHALRQRLAEQYPSLPYFLLGHSMGSFVARSYSLRYEKGLKGLILSGTGHFDPPIIGLGNIIAKAQCALGMAKKPSNLLNGLNFKSNNKQVESPRTDFDWLTRDEAHVDKYIADPLCGFVFTAGGYRDMFDGLSRLYPDKLSAMDKDIPVLLFSGDRDPVGANGAGVTKVYNEIKAAGVKDVTVKLYKDGRHEMFNELNRAEIVADLISWLNEQRG